MKHRLLKNQSRTDSAVKKTSTKQRVFLYFLLQMVCRGGKNSSFTRKSVPHISLYNSEILQKIDFITIFFRDFPFISVLDWTVAGNDRFKLVFPWLFKGNVIEFLQTDFK